MYMKTLAGMMLLCCLALCAGPGRALDTDLGEDGNREVGSAFSAYAKANPLGACRAGEGKRVILTGYGLFMGAAYNISGEVVMAMADPGFWPAGVYTSNSYKFPRDYRYTPRLQAGLFSNGAVVRSRELEIDGEKYSVCFIAFEVSWDQAAAILIHEASHFKPELMVMTGRGVEATFEGTAVNRASSLSGYTAGGSVNNVNSPKSSWILEDYPVDYELKSTWNGKALWAATRRQISRLGYSVYNHAGPTAGNDYLCNNITFLALHATQRNLPVRLAGSREDGYAINLRAPGLDKKPQVGFFHYPAISPKLARYGNGVFGWAKVMATVISASLGSGTAAAAAPAAVPQPAAAQPSPQNLKALESLRNFSF
jgi:hypothetical protein